MMPVVHCPVHHQETGKDFYLFFDLGLKTFIRCCFYQFPGMQVTWVCEEALFFSTSEKYYRQNDVHLFMLVALTVCYSMSLVTVQC